MQILVYMIYSLVAIAWLLCLGHGLKRWHQRVKVFLFAIFIIILSKLLRISIINPILWFGLFQLLVLNGVENRFSLWGNRFLDIINLIIITLFASKSIELIHSIDTVSFWYLHGILTGLLISSVVYTFIIRYVLKTLFKNDGV